ncbi:maleylacetoacetate isomerase [Shewanella psychrotolerans]|uniref:maleylacetoacetate isomerase n=1 Tax=Shewanella psychrotolerans TaxID=2864206 RepID=UPI001C65C11E|nr:maleylacetoacetate isomerase [Shewanella psychrotolerans]QYK00246.1 maleylacetoacetate isomerase [Shewanella psychrotolerans]
MKLLGYWRSSAAYRVRIALNLKGLDAELQSVHLVKDGGEQHSAQYAALNPQELVPTLIEGDDEFVLSQSLAIIEYLDEIYPQHQMLPAEPKDRALVRAMALSVACEIHPLNNLRVLQYLSGPLGLGEEAKTAWYQHWIHQGFTALEKQLVEHSGTYCFGDNVTLADLCLIPQIYNANRFKVDLTVYPNICRIWDNCHQLDAFVKAAPENQDDAS